MQSSGRENARKHRQRGKRVTVEEDATRILGAEGVAKRGEGEQRKPHEDAGGSPDAPRRHVGEGGQGLSSY